MAEPQVETGPLRILVVDDEEHIRFALTMSLEAAGHRVVAQGTIQGALAEAARHAFDLIFLDVRLGTENGLDYIPQLLDESPWARIVVITAYASIDTAVEAMKRGASDYLPKPFEHKQLLLLTQKVAERRQIERQMAALQHALGAMDPEADFPTVSAAYRDAIELARRVAPTQTSVMISGEAGTGRARLARAIHAWSLRPAGPFVTVSARAESAETLEAELFGGGGNAGAVAHAHGGTLLIEDVAEFPPRLQPRLLALLRDKEFERVDAPVRRPIDVRVIATAGPGLDAAVREGRFRMDLFGALSVVRIDLPLLRDRPDDVPLLAERYLAHFAREHHRPIVGFTRDALFLLNGHTWPGNARELRNVIERAVLVCNGEQVGLEHLPAELVNAAATSRNGETPAAAGGYAIGDLVPLDVIEELHIRKVLATARTTRRASAILGINPSTLFRKLRRLRGEAEAESKDDSDDQADDDQPTS